MPAAPEFSHNGDFLARDAAGSDGVSYDRFNSIVLSCVDESITTLQSVNYRVPQGVFIRCPKMP